MMAAITAIKRIFLRCSQQERKSITITLTATENAIQLRTRLGCCVYCYESVLGNQLVQKWNRSLFAAVHRELCFLRGSVVCSAELICFVFILGSKLISDVFNVYHSWTANRTQSSEIFEQKIWKRIQEKNIYFWHMNRTSCLLQT